MFLIKFHDGDEFCQMKLAHSIHMAKQYIKSLYGTEVNLQFLDDNLYQIIINGTEVGFVGRLEII